MKRIRIHIVVDSIIIIQVIQEMDQQPEQHEQPEQEIPLPDYGQIQGQTIKLSGLDYSLMKEEAAKDRKNELMSRLKNKLNQYNIRMPLTAISQDQFKNHTNDQLTKNIILANTLKPSIDPSTFYLFPTEPHFSPHLPQLITRRFGKMHIAPLYIHHSLQDIQTLKQLITLDQKLKQANKIRMANSAKVVSAIQSDDNDSDDIFGQSQGQAQQNKSFPHIKVGNKLSFGINDIQVFGGKRYKKTEEEQDKQPEKQIDKYQFLRKKVKPNEQAQDYGQCYPIMGPSLDEMRQLRKEGIQLFGDAKQFVQRKQKYNVHKDYQKIKRIIDQKSKPKS